MAGQPVALQGRNQRLDIVVDAGSDGGIGHGQKGDGDDKGARNPVGRFPFQNEIEKDNAPGKEDHGFVEIGQGDMADPQVVGQLPPPDKSAGLHGKSHPGGHGRQPTPEGLAENSAKQIKNKSGKIDESYPTQDRRMRHIVIAFLTAA